MTQDSNKSELSKARIAVERLLKIRLRSHKELFDKLTLKNFSTATIAAIIKQYTQLGLVDDRLFAKSWITSRLKRPFGSNRIYRELLLKGIDKTIINEELEAASKEVDELETVTQLAEHRLKKYSGLDREKSKQRIYGYLKRRGFNHTAIMKAIKEI